MEYFSFEDFRKEYLTPLFREIRYRTHVKTSTKFIPCCMMHAIEEFETMQYEYENLVVTTSIMSYTKSDEMTYRHTGDLFVLCYRMSPYAIDWVTGLSTIHNVSFTYHCNLDPNCDVYLIQKKYRVRERMKKLFFAFCCVRMWMHRRLVALYKPPHGAIFKKLVQQSSTIISTPEYFQSCPPNSPS